MPLHRPWDDHAPPRAHAMTIYRPVKAPHPAIPRGQLARTRDGTWYYRPDGDGDGNRPLPDLLRPDLDHALRRRGQLLTEIDRATRDAQRKSLKAAFTALGTREVLDLEDALHDAADSWHHARPRPEPSTWTPAPPDLADLAETLRPAGTRFGAVPPPLTYAGSSPASSTATTSARRKTRSP